MKHIATVALMLNLGVASVYAQEKPVKMVISGTAAPSTINLQTGTGTTEYSLAGNGTLGPFILRAVSAGTASPQESSTCPSPKLYIPTIAGEAVFRFQDGSLLTITVKQGTYCIDFNHLVGHLNETYEIKSGTGRFEGASGTLTYTYTHKAVLLNASNAPALLALTGEIEGTVSVLR